MIVFQLTLKGWEGSDTTPETEACIKWVKARSQEQLTDWLCKTGLNELVAEVDTNPLADYGFEDGVDVILDPNTNEAEYKDNPTNNWPKQVEAAIVSMSPGV